MELLRIAVFSLLVISVLSATSKCGADFSFPPSFKFGVSTASYQIEGAWNVSDKSPSIWDHFTHTKPQAISDRSNGDIACDSYHLWKRDIEMASELGVHFYRFSISWPRLLPTGYSNHISEDGKNYYNNLINGLLEKGIEPAVTLYHWDLPQTMQDLGGWSNALIVDWFAEYSRVVFSLFGDRVKTWFTINEATAVCDIPYMTGILAPGIISPEVAPFLCNKHILLAHAKAWRIYDVEFKPKWHGRVSISNHLLWFEPYSTSKEDETFAQVMREFVVGRYCHPIYSEQGGWPPIVEAYMREESKRQGYSKSRLPSLTAEEIKLIKGTFDFFAMNHYTSRLVRKVKAGETPGPLLWGAPINAVLDVKPDWTFGYSKYLAVYPEGIRHQMAWLKESYGNVEIFITENGYSTTGSNLDDDERIDFMKNYLEQVLLSINKDKVNVTAYTFWSLMDNFEWAEGYRSRFGLYEVDFSDPLRKRTARKSAQYYANVISHNSLSIRT